MFKFLFRLIILALVLLGLGVVFAPNLASTKWGKSLFLKAYKAVTGKNLSIDSLHVSWWEGQELEGISLIDKSGKTVFEGKKIVTDSTLWQIAFYHNLGNCQIDSPKVVIETELPKKLAWLQAGFLPQIAMAQTMPVYFGHLMVSNGSAQFLSPGLDPIQLAQVGLDASFFKSQVKLKGSGLTSQGKIEGRFDIAGMYSSIEDIDMTANLQNFPVRSIDQLVALSHPALQGGIVGAIGDAMNIQLKVKNLPKTLELYCDASSPSFSAHLETQSQDGIVTLAAPATIQFQVPPANFKKYTQLNEQFQGELKIDNLSLPLNDKESFSFSATLKGQQLGIIQPFTLFVSTENFKERNFSLKADSQQIQLNSALYLPSDWTRLTWQGQGLFPHNTRVDFSAQTLSNVTASVQGDEWQGSFLGGYDPVQNTLFLNKPAQILYNLSQLPAPLPPLLTEPLPVHLVIQPFKLSLTTLSGPLNAQISLDRFQLEHISLDETKVSLTGDLKTRKGTFDLLSKIEEGTIAASGTLQWPDQIAAKLTLTQAPTALLDLFVAKQITSLLGTPLNGTVDISTAAKQLSFQLSSPSVTAQASLEQKGEMYQLTKPAQLTLNLTPEGYTALDHWLNPTPTPFILVQPALIKATVSSFQWPQKLYKADLTIDTLAFASKEISNPTSLNTIQLHVEHLAANLYDFTLNAAGAPQGALALQGKFDLETGFTQLKCKLDQFPAEALDIVARAAGQSNLSMATLFGSQVNLTANSSLKAWTGPVDLQLNSPNIRASLNGMLTQGVLTLKDPLYLQMALNHDLSSMILKTLNPLSVTSFESHDPVTLEIPAQGFSYPVIPYNHAKINIPKGRLELGKIYCKNEGNINITMGLLKLSQYSQNDTLEMWFAPLDFKITDGVMECERTEILVANNYQICSWGDIDFADNRVDMILGLTASCLSKAFKIKDLPENYVLRIPMKGPLNNVKIDTSKATTKIGLLLIWQQKDLAGSFGGGPAGGIAGKFLNKIGPLPDGDSKAPPPKRPFPWEQGAPVKKKKLSDHRKLIDPDEQPLKQALKFLR